MVNKTTFYKLIDASKASDLHSVKKTAAPKARKPQGMGISDPVELNKSILKLIQAVPMITQIEIFAILSPGHSESAFNAHMAKLEQQGLITRVASAGKNSGRGHRKSCCLTKKYIDSLNLNEDERQKLMTLHLISTDEVMTTPPLTKEQEIQPGQQPLSELQTLATTKLPQETANLIQQERILISHIANFPGILRSELAEKEELLMSATKIRISLNKLEEKQIIRYVKTLAKPVEEEKKPRFI
ncbi:MAG: winged helix-turn-helix domain-containing protein [Coxiellaceae bacterium]|nr:MAG: winged helix-turn-helix domain-containing protein [Coxiellaceae bacterium]